MLESMSRRVDIVRKVSQDGMLPVNEGYAAIQFRVRY